MEKFHHVLPTTKTTGEGETEKQVASKYKISLPRFDNIPFGLIRKNRKLAQSEQFFALLEELCSDADLEALDNAAQGEVNKFITAWQKDSGVEVGES